MAEIDVDPKPRHRWSGDSLGHNCADCDWASVWKCDQPAHEQWRERLRDWLVLRASEGDKTAAMLLGGVEEELAAATLAAPVPHPAATDVGEGGGGRG